ncbi:regulatory protein [Streptomyces albireticuli]|uniref:Regulatory protein n=1 Tax=Streptomyces albireticuli TaxID=1940 RepID=A0A1Z2L089_9ACTN|nr:response regulator transcription factor [Streptomyces albireticuli]ARZ67719.1 regulatory protein [Streptomyces albireticuli]
MAGDRERALALTKRGLRLLDETEDPLRSAWFWTQRGKLMVGLARGDGWAEIERAQRLVSGLPASPVHAEVVTHAAGWQATHAPGAGAFETAERAVGLARLVGAEGTELSARLTRGGLMIDSGEVEAGLAEMRAVCARVAEEGHLLVLTRSHVNLASALEGVGRSAEAAEVAAAGAGTLDRFGLRDARGWVYGNLAESLFSLGRWEEADRAACDSLRLAQGRKPRGTASLRLAELALARGDHDAAERELAAAREYYGTHDEQPQYTVPLARLTLELAAARGRILEAREALAGPLARGLTSAVQRYGWPLLVAAATAEADARGLPAAEPGRAAVLDGIRAAAGGLARHAPVWEAYGLFLEAELPRAEGRDDAGRWAAAVAAFEPLDRPYELARARYRWADALLAAGDARSAAGPLARAHEEAGRLGAVPLRDAVALLARRARLPLGGDAAPARAAAPEPDPAEALGLTPRERDVLRLVAAGRGNRQIAEELFISPKTASVHVSRIIAKLGVSSRGEAAATAHRLRLVSLAGAV